jgi:ribonuclease D
VSFNETSGSIETLDLPGPLVDQRPPPPDLGWEYVSSPAALASVVERLRGATVLGIDTESDSFFSYRESCCLVQLTAPGLPDFIIDPLAVPDLSALGPLFADPAICKVFQGADYDIVILKRDFGFTFRNLFDTMIAAQATGHPRFGLADLVFTWFGTKLDKRWQRHDWSSRPLLPEHLQYARLDSHFLPDLREILRGLAAERGREAMLEEEFSILEAREWTGRPVDPNDCLRLKGAQGLSPDQLRVLRSVFLLRETIAQAKNRPVFKVWSHDDCLLLARTAPKNARELAAALGGQHHLVRRYGRELVDAVTRGLSDTSPPPERFRPEPRRPGDPPPFLREDEPLLEAMKVWRNDIARARAVAPAMVVANHLLRAVAAVKPASEEDLADVPDLRRWQRAEFGADLVRLVGEWLAHRPPPPPRPTEGERAGRRRGGRRRRRRATSPEAPAPS